MKKTMVLGLGMAMSVLVSLPMAQAEEVSSLRGANELDSSSNRVDPKRWQADREPIQRDYVQQPPLVPHAIEGYKVNLKFNKCLTCHSWANYKEANATKISQTHFEDRSGDVHANVAARRYFCTQCHVPQVNAQPLVENTFQPVETIKRR